MNLTLDLGTPESTVPEIVIPDSDITHKTVCLKVTFGLIGNTRKVSNSQVTVDADKALIRVSKQLLDSPELVKIRKLDSEMRRYLYDTCLPFETGIHLLPIPLVPFVDAKLHQFQAQRESLIQDFIVAYPSLCERASERLHSLYNPNDYPLVGYVASKFTFSWKYQTFGVPGQLKQISASIFEEEREKASRSLVDASNEIQQVLRSALAEMVSHLKDRLTEDEPGKAKRLHATAVTKMQEFLASFDFRNITNDVELKAEVDKLRQIMGGVNVEAIRDVESLRVKIRDNMAEISTRLDGLVSDKPIRKFREEDDDA